MNHSAHTDQELLTLIRQSDVAAFTALYNRYFRTLYGTAENIIRSAEVSQDIIQEIFISIWQNRQSLEIAHPKAYLQQAVRFQVFKAIRADKADAEFYKRLAQVTEEMVIDHGFSFKEFQHTVDELIESLPEDCRVPFQLSREQELTYNQIAEKLNVSVKTVEKKMSRSLRYLRLALFNSPLSH